MLCGNSVRICCLGRTFRLYSDHESLSKFQKQPDLKKRDWRWAELLSDYSYEHYYRPGPTMFVPDAISRAFMGPDAHPTGVLAPAIELEAPFSGVNDLWVTPTLPVGTSTDQGAPITNSSKGALVTSEAASTSGKAITYGAAVRTVTTVLTRRQARKRTSHELLPGMTIPEVSRVTPVVLESVKETRKVESTPKGGRKEHAVGLLSSVDPKWSSTVA